MADDWFADESFWQVAYPFMFGEGAFARAPVEVESMLALAGISSGALLDLACGPGRHAAEFARKGFAVTGVDRSPFLLRKAAEHCKALGVERITWVQSDMRDFDRPKTFDLVTCLFTSFGFFESDADNRRVLARVRANLKPSGRFVLEVMGKETLARIYQPTGSTHVPGVGTVFMRRKFSEAFTRMENEWTYVLEDGTVRVFSLRHWVYSAWELELMLRDAGFSDVQVFGDFKGGPYDPAAPRLVVVGTV